MPRSYTIMGHHAPPPRITRRAVRLGALWIGLPFIAFCFALDFLIRGL
ncbi:MAG: hypothetical protein OIF48_19570 [Silicimonas sp.]|nr:hypothetical protein [Silicimonas sp.]